MIEISLRACGVVTASHQLSQDFAIAAGGVV
jgi:hypothetical protein